MLFSEIVVRLLKSPEDSEMSSGDLISLLSAVISAAAIFVGVWQFRVGLRRDREARVEDADRARLQRQADDVQARSDRAQDEWDARQQAKEDGRKAWLSSVLIQPNLPLINDFFNNVSGFASVSIDALVLLSSSFPPTSPTMTNEKLLRTSRFNRIKQEFDYSFVGLVEAQNRAFGQKLRNWLNELDDIVSNPLGNIGYNLVSKVDVERHIFEHKALFFELLYTEMQQASV